ncbi:MAG: DUF3617 family protein [Betaproteobacteria bacterium]
MRIPITVLAALLTSAVAITALAADDFPKLKAGQWEMQTGAAKGATTHKTTMCTDDAVQKELISMGVGMQKEMCTKNDMRREGSRVTSTSQCKFGESTVNTKAVMTFTGDTAYRTEIDSTYSPPFMGMKDAKTIMEGKYVGPCRDGLVPGDMLLPNGQKMNIKNIGSARMPAASKAK